MIRNLIDLRLLVLTAVLFATGCAHKINITPETSKLIGVNMKKADYAVGYHISPNMIDMPVETPGGGGDNVTYTPYKDTESALFTVLSKKFKDVYQVKSLNDSSFIKDNEIKLVFLPTITTNSSSSSFMTWPPTSFTVDLDVKAIDSKGDIVWRDSAFATGQAEFSEFQADFGLAAKRATEEAFIILAEKLANSKKLESVPE